MGRFSDPAVVWAGARDAGDLDLVIIENIFRTHLSTRILNAGE